MASLQPFRKRLSPVNWTYLSVHALIFVGGISLYQIGSLLFTAVGTSLVATGIAGWVIFFWIRANEERTNALRALDDVGIVNAFAAARSVPIRHEYESRFASSREQISIMGFGLRALREDFGDRFPEWARRTRVRVLLLDPEAPGGSVSYADQRDLEESNPLGSIRRDVIAFLAFTNDLRKAHPDSFQVRLYKCLPSVNVCVIDHEAFWGPYFVGQQSRSTVTFACRKGGHMYDALVRHFDLIWDGHSLSREASSEDVER